MLRSVRTTIPSALRGARSFSSTSVNSIKIAARDSDSAVSTLSVIVKAGSRYSPAPGVAHILEKFAFRTTSGRSALRLVRESELLGASLSSKIDRNSIILSSVFLKENLPYFVNALGDVLSSTSFRPHELTEEASHYAKIESDAAAQDPFFLASEAVHATAFRTGLGNQLYADATSPVSLEAVKDYSLKAYTKDNVAVVGSGVNKDDLAKFIEESSFSTLSTAEPLTSVSGAFSGETRIKFAGANVATLAYPVSSPSSAHAVLAAVLGGTPAPHLSTSLSPLAVIGATNSVSAEAKFLDYGDAGLFTITVAGADAADVSKALKEAVKALKSVSSEAVSKANAQAKFTEALNAESNFVEITGKELLGFKTAAVDATTLESVKSAVSSLNKPNLAVVGKVQSLPYLDELF